MKAGLGAWGWGLQVIGVQVEDFYHVVVMGFLEEDQVHFVDQVDQLARGILVVAVLHG